MYVSGYGLLPSYLFVNYQFSPTPPMLNSTYYIGESIPIYKVGTETFSWKQHIIIIIIIIINLHLLMNILSYNIMVFLRVAININYIN